MPNLDPNGLLFSTVDQFVEQVGRRYVWKWAELDNMTCIFNGPSSGALNFKPKVNAPHPNYPLMFCTDSAITAQAALVSEITATYQGIIQTNGASSYVTPGVITESPVQGSRDFSIPFITQSVNPTFTTSTATGGPVAGYSTPPYYDYGTYTVTVRYIGTQCNVRYQAYPKPSPSTLHYQSLGKGRVTWSILSQYHGPRQVAGSKVELAVAQAAVAAMGNLTAVPTIFAAWLGVTRTQKGLWYDCVETYGPSF